MRGLFSNIMAIYRKELQGYFASPLAYAIAAVFWLLSGFFFVAMLLGPEGIIAQAALLDQFGGSEPVDIAYQFQQLFLGVIGNLSLFVLPILSMGLYAEERKRGTLELLATSPITNWAIATGKLLGAVTFFTAMIVPLLLYEAIALSAADPPVSLAVPLVGHLGLILLAASVLALGMFISSLTESTILAAVLTFALVLFLWVIDLVANGVGGAFGQILSHLSLLKHYTNLVRGILDTSSLILFGSYVILGLFLTAQSIETLRFQRS
ncbi:ABC transporter permease subunit [Desertifilum sp. FACHB-1129]|uniref:ABC transporter permease n=1 Tax=Desertifilum tharense IPPAS B-1220 TaxID=1781255 RepID=A0A1E5QHF8_9CYAN|nr:MULTISPECIES: ABC transporter permease [Desertifilum]MCD8485304.1 ABC transporter permease [Desertifilum sp.]MDA0209130.1 ABC transporter permease [Cyanobacteria bacterium FC1]MBD2311785.1 ABC transporter permease subunit [Desertifilum sp. FACHB-1129]MBD2325029.1 ABC transporter permease subunit [Desertifilum sp. FACHB-866]MBD2333360.1 ABC transporter permease subunit [Desertifilum sp. FACHB-868]